MKKLIAAALLAGAAFIAVPTAANAAGYTPDSDVSVSGNYVAGGTAVVSFTPGAYISGETVRVQVTGAGNVTLGALPVLTTSRDYTANADGSLTVRVTFPAGGSGTYNLTATGASSGVTGNAVFTIAPAGTAGTAGTVGSTGNSGTPGQLAFTGGTISTLGLWAAGGAIVLGGGLLVVRKSVRRQHDAA